MLTVADIMTREPIIVSPQAPLGDVISIMKNNHCRQLPVMDGDRLVGIITDRDVRLAVNSPLVMHERTEEVTLLHNVSAEDVMTPDPMTIGPDAPASSAADLLRTYKFGALPVLDHGRLVGIVSVSDVLTSFIRLSNQPSKV